jgi:ribosomal-protein-alanine N-acetyltransferase
VRRPAPRPFGPADVEAVTALERAVFGDPWPRRAFEEILELEHVRGFVVEDGHGDLAGYAFCSAAADEGEILNLAVAPAQRRRGMGRALLDACLAWMGGRGAATVYLEVRPSNGAAIAMYGEAGFERRGVRREYYRKPTEDAVTMALALAGQPAGK